MADALELIQDASFVLDGSGCVIGSNAEAEKLLGQVLAVRRGELLVSGRADVTAALKHHFSSVLGKEKLPEGSVEGVVVPRVGRRPLFVRAYRLRRVADDAGMAAHALAFVADPDRESAPPRFVLQAMFDLSDSEARLVQALTGGKSLSTAARQMGVTYETARTYLKAIFAKTGSRQQSELAALTSRLGRIHAED